MTNEIAKQEWTKFFDEISKTRLGWETRVEIFKSDIGAQRMSEGLPLNGFMVEKRNGEMNAIHIMLGEDANTHQTHTIVTPRKVFFENKGNEDGIIEIEDNDGGKTLIYFVQPVSVLVEYEESELVAQV